MNLVLLIMALPSRISHSSLNTKHTWGLGGHSCDYVTNSYGESWNSCWEKSWVPLQNHWAPVQCPGSLCNQALNLKTDSKTLYYSLRRLLRQYSFYGHAQQWLKEICFVKQQTQEQPQKSHKQDILQKHLQIDQWIFASYGTHTTDCFTSLGILCIRDARGRGNKIAASGLNPMKKSKDIQLVRLTTEQVLQSFLTYYRA